MCEIKENFNATALQTLKNHFVLVENGHWTASEGFTNYCTLYKGNPITITTNPRTKKNKVIKLLERGELSWEEIAEKVSCTIPNVRYVAKQLIK